MITHDTINQLRNEGRLILCLKGNVYDLTDFQHPGGQAVLKTASLSADPWASFSSFHDASTLEAAKDFLLGNSNQPTTGSSFLSASSKAAPVPWWPFLPAEQVQHLSLPAIKREAEKRVPKPLLLYWNEGNEDNESLLANELAWTQMKLRPRVLRDVRVVETSTTVLGFPLSFPLLVAPFVGCSNAHPEGELAVARACAQRRVGFVIPHFGGFKMSEMAEALHSSASVGVPLFFQYYSRASPTDSMNLDREHTVAVFRYAETLGFKAVFVTVDSPVLGIREQTYGSTEWVDSLKSIPRGGFVKIKTFYDLEQGRSQVHCAALSWEDIRWMSTICSLKVIVKGIMHPEDAARAADPRSGIAGLVVSNHGGRQMDGTEGTAAVLSECAEAVRVTAARHGVVPIEVYVDGGIRRGKDVVRALAMGARACLIGRPVLWGLSVGGESGVGRVLDCLLQEFRTGMKLCGQAAANDVCPSILRNKL